LIGLEIFESEIECKNIQGRGIGELGNLWKIIAVEITGHFAGLWEIFRWFRGDFRKFGFFSDFFYGQTFFNPGPDLA
jgi:hypothetical protein